MKQEQRYDLVFRIHVDNKSVQLVSPLIVASKRFVASNSKGSKEVSVAGARTHPRRRSTTSAVPRLGPTPTAAADDAPSCLTPTGAHGPLGDNEIFTDDDCDPEPDSDSPSSSTRTPDPASHRISNGGGTRLISSATRDATAIHPAPAQTPVRYTATGTEPGSTQNTTSHQLPIRRES